MKVIFSLPEVQGKDLAFLSMHICQDPVENYFGCQRQRGGTNENPTVAEFGQNTQALRVLNGNCRGPVRGNCRGEIKKRDNSFEDACRPLPRKSKKTTV